jgi:CO/xanthine dehydrogenase Mo-binding subunit
MSEYSIVGKSVVRKDAYDKATGRAKYSADFHPEGMLYGKLFTSTIAHGYIKKLDVSKAEALPGVIAVLTGADCSDERTDGYIHDRHILCKHKVRYIGDGVAAVAALTPEIAAAACNLIEVEYEELPHVLDPMEARAKDCPIVIHPDLPSYHNIEWQGVWSSLDAERPNQFIHRKIVHGDVEKGFEEADFIYEGTYTLPRAAHCCLEPHAVVAKPESNGELTVWASEQGGCFQKYGIAEAMGITPSKIHLIVPYLGGGFGGKVGIMYTPICCMLALKAGRPVKMEMTREEVFVNGDPRCPGYVVIKDGFKKDGTLVARQIEETINSGAYSTHTTVFVSAGIYGATGTYKCPNLKIDAYGVYTNTPCTGPYRSLGSEILVFAIESQMDAVAEELGIDRIELRRKNILRDGDEDSIGQITYNNGTEACLDKAVAFLDFNGPVRAPEGPWVFGRGISIGNKFTAYWDTGTVAGCKVHDDGTIEIRTFHVELGQGAHTVLAQIAAEEFQTDFENIKVVFCDTALCPYDEGTYCSRGTYINGNAVMLACRDAKRQLFEAASDVMGIAADKLGTKDGMVYELDNPDNAIPFFNIYEYGGYLKKGGEIYGLDTYLTTFDEDDRETGQSKDVITFYSYGALAFEVGINKETGEVKVMKSGGWYDMGYPLNPKLVELQLEGAMVMGIGQALYEEMLFNDDGKNINPNFRDYRIPTMLDVPFNDQIDGGFAGSPHRDGPYGAKGIGEVALVPVMPAISNAIHEALGIKIKEIPLTRERILAAVKELEEDKAV